MERFGSQIGGFRREWLLSGAPARGIVRVERYPVPVVFEVVTVEGLSHHWPSGGAQLNPRLAGPPSAAFHATEAIWAFFQQT